MEMHCLAILRYAVCRLLFATGERSMHEEEEEEEVMNITGLFFCICV